MCFSSSVIVLLATDHNDNGKYSKAEQLVYDFVDSVNNKDTNLYLSLFVVENRKEMEAYISRYTDANFFKENNIVIKHLKKLSNKVGKESASITEAEYSKYSNVIVYYAEEVINFENQEETLNDNLSNGYSYKVYVIVKENNEWKILRVSTANINKIENANENFKTYNEKEKLEEQKSKSSIIPKP